MTEWSNLKESLSITRVITDETGLQIRKVGANQVLSSCPFCVSGNGPNKSSAFSAKNDRLYKCFACSRTGDAANFIAEQRKMTNGEAIQYLLEKYGNGIKKSFNTDYSEWDKRLYAIKNNNKSQAILYLEKERKISVNKLPEGCFYYDSFLNAVVFLSQNEQLLNLRFINPEIGKSKAINQTSGEKTKKKDCLYTACFKKLEKTVFITEGVINSLSLFPYSSISIFDAGNNVDLNLLKPFVENKTVVLAFDNDEAGKKAFSYYTNLIREADISLEIRHLTLPIEEGKAKDINDLLIEGRLEQWLTQESSYKLVYRNRILESIEETSSDVEEMWKVEEYYHKDCRYYGRDQKGNERQLSNFLMDIIYHFPDGSKNSLRYLKLQSRKDNHLETEFILLDAESLSSIQKFKSALYSYGEYIFKGTAKDLDVIKESLGRKTENAIRIETLGWSQEHNAYLFSNGAIEEEKFVSINRFGIVNTKKERLFIPALSEIYKENDGYMAHRRFVYNKGSFDMHEFTNLIDTAYNENGVTGLLFSISAIFSDIIFREIGFFPILFLYGTAGSGKTSFANFLLGLFGEPQNPISLSGYSSGKAVLRKLSQYSNALVFLNEYRPDNAGKNDDLIVNIYDRVSYETASFSNDNRTNQREICSGVIVDGNFLPVKHPRTYSRLIQLDFMEKSFSENQKAAYKRLEDILNTETFSGLLFEILKYRNIIDKRFRQEYYQVVDEVKKQYNMVQFDNRILVNYCVLLTILKLLKNPLRLELEYEKTTHTLMEIAKIQQAILSQTNEAEQFFEAVETNLNSGELFSRHLLEPSRLHLHYATAYVTYAEHMRKTGGLAIDKQAMKKLLLRHQSFISDGQIMNINGKSNRVISFDSSILQISN
ncbi:MAG TPA: CHC2 zinc finger domain-containing protein [Edaphocola sp.]|nr:CHC2 zinc finger domain-containing protein [Edaphocola sp.]